MNTELIIERKRISDLERATYNPRANLLPGDDEYEKLRNSILKNGMIIPVVWNKRTNTVVGGHQRLTVLENEGEEFVDVSVVDLDIVREKQLNIALNKIDGKWDDEKLLEIFEDLGDDATETGFDEIEIENLQNDINNLVDDSFLEDELSAIEKIFNLSLTFDRADRADINAYIKDYGKEELVQVIIAKVKGEI